MNYFLIVVAAVLIISTLIGMSRGLVKTFFGLFGVAVILLITSIIAPVITQNVKENTKIYNTVLERIEKQLDETILDEDLLKESLIGEGSENEKIVNIAGFSVPVEIVESVLQNTRGETKKAEKKIRAAVIKSVSGYLADRAVSAGSFACVFLVLYAIKWVLEHALGIIARLPVLKNLNKLGGGIGGFCGGVVIVWVLFLVVTLASGTEMSKHAMKDIQSSPALTYMYERAPFINSVKPEEKKAETKK